MGDMSICISPHSRDEKHGEVSMSLKYEAVFPYHVDAHTTYLISISPSTVSVMPTSLERISEDTSHLSAKDM